jgi:serine/threonine protein kinase
MGFAWSFFFFFMVENRNEMNRYKVISTIGDGSFGVVAKAINISTGETVAIKRMKKKYKSWEECIQLREVKVRENYFQL